MQWELTNLNSIIWHLATDCKNVLQIKQEKDLNMLAYLIPIDFLSSTLQSTLLLFLEISTGEKPFLAIIGIILFLSTSFY